MSSLSGQSHFGGTKSSSLSSAAITNSDGTCSRPREHDCDNFMLEQLKATSVNSFAGVQSPLLDTYRHGAKQVTNSNASTMVEGQKPLLRQDRGMSSNDLGSVEADRIVRAVTLMARCDGQ